MKFIYIDESGGLKGNFDYFNISLLIFNNEKDLKKLKNSIKRFRRGKYKKQLRNVKEIKAYNNDKKLIRDLLKTLNKIEFEAYSLFYDNKKDYLKNHTVNGIYQLMILELLNIVNSRNTNINIYIDKFLPKVLEKQFIIDMEKNLNLNNNYSNVSCIASENNIGIQFADLVSWSTFQYLERNNKIFLQIIENKHEIMEFNKK
ncbi:hypothetical protein SDC9_37516 [bioreactor metagenome]|uniref:DUF3800 domain-containing protein n=1 Tax=bioreactor metagenome TaxID=1076179 RepID=A0A644VJC8_9ZZZZ|nr:DUF3800 domain-containing protein [Methanobrevibacter sp.]MEA4957927.1 DUF3800 domain-containing protein [Methanobrevibacter sp.]